MTIGELLVKLSVSDGNFRTGMERAKKSIDVAKKAVESLSGTTKSTSVMWNQLAVAANRSTAQMAGSTSKATSSIKSSLASQGQAMRGAAQSMNNMASTAESTANRTANAFQKQVNAMHRASAEMRRIASMPTPGLRGGNPLAGLAGLGNPGGSSRIAALAAGSSAGAQAAREARRSPFGGFAARMLSDAGGSNMFQGQSPSRGTVVGPNFAKLIGKSGKGTIDWGANDPDSPQIRSGNTMIGNPAGAFARQRAGDGTIMQFGPRPTPGAPAAKGPGFIGRFRNALSERSGGGGGGRRGGAGGGGGGGGGGRWGGPGNRMGPLGEVSTFRRVLMGAGVIQGATEFGQLADTYAQLQMRLVGLTGSQEKANDVFERLRTISKNTNSSLEATTEGYVRIKNATAAMNLSEEDSFKLMENLNLMLVTSGASTQEAASGMRQLTQAFAKGKLDGDEFKSIAENMPNILKELGKSLGKTEGQMRTMSERGELTRDKLVKMLLNVKNLQKPVDTFASSWQKFKDDLMVSFGIFTKQNDLVKDFGEVLKVVGKILMEDVIPFLGDLFKWLKENTWAVKALIGLALASFFWGVAKSLFGFPISILVNMWKAYKAIALWAGAAKAAMAGGGAAGGVATGASGFIKNTAAAKGANAAGGAAGSAGTGLAAALLGSAASWLPPVVLSALASEVSGGSLDVGEMLAGRGTKPNSAFDKAIDVGNMMSWQPGQKAGGSSVSINEINVQIQATDMTDAQEKFSKEMMDNMMRQAGAVVAR